MKVTHSQISVEMTNGTPHLSWSGNVSQRDLDIARKWAVLGRKG